MTISNQKYYVFISAYRLGCSEAQNRVQHAMLVRDLLLSLTPYDTVLGQYEGVPEVSVCISVDGLGRFEFIQTLLKRYRQQCALVVEARVDMLLGVRAGFLYPDDDYATFSMPHKFAVTTCDWAHTRAGYSFWRGRHWYVH
jgi:hypothetical protein